jgi:hypothetical protein
MFLKIKKIVLSKTVIVVFSLVVSFGMITGAFIYRVKKANGYCVTPNGMYCFGGTITAVQFCCNGMRISISPPRDGDFLLSYGSMVYMWWNPTVGQCVTGDAYPGGICTIPCKKGCCRGPKIDGVIRQMGTTLMGPPAGMCNGQMSI